ncbi:P-loop NTPase fold protein [Thalassotalea atypica]|uniref:P-loop NTPase fold protein n=1 Tax=Thalassotalea atypica TaxID=2054316 RepID=UPI0025726AFF|nr:P-loop NTPase fold protein [Thalassotalea atypica]
MNRHWEGTLMLKAFINKYKLSPSYQDVANKWFIPLSNNIEQHLNNDKSPLMIGLNGCQGIGKSTLVAFIADYLKSTFNLNVVTFSIDDFYYCQEKRKKLADRIHPLLVTRGVPGTHDTSMLKQVLISLKQQKSTLIPRFNKAIDNPFPATSWPKTNENTDIVIVDGWCWGVPPQHSEALSSPINELEKFKDPQQVWRTYVNERLASHYQPLYTVMDKWILLKAPDFKQVAQWRWQQEQKLALDNPHGGNYGIMDFEQVKHFVSYFQRLTTHGLKVLPKTSNIIFEFDEQREIILQTGEL